MKAELFIQNKAVDAIQALYATSVKPEDLQVQQTRKEFAGDYTLVTFPLLKISHSSPENTANAIGEWLKANVEEIADYNTVKGFLNLSFSSSYWNNEFLSFAKNDSFGQLKPSGKNIMVEFSSPNTNKPLHLGHIRNNLLGDSVSRLLQANGHNVTKVTLVNDRGVHICKSMLAWQKRGNNATPQTSGKKGDHFVGDCYVEFNNILQEQIEELVASGMPKEEAKKNAPCLKEAQDMLLKWEQNDADVRALWQMMNKWVLDGFEETYQTMGISFDKVYYESQTYLLGKELVLEGLRKNVFVRDEDGSVWCDLTADGLDRKLLLRSDGTSVYMTQDLGTAERRFSENHLDEHVYVVGNEQDYHFQVLKLVLKKLGFDWADSIYHLSYGMVELPEGKMKSREGTVVDADDLIEKMYQEAKNKTIEAGKLADIDEQERERLYNMIGLGALKYFIIKVDPKKTMLFNPQESIDFNGNTGPFIQYTHARICSILRKAEQQNISYSADTMSENIEASVKETRLIKLLSTYEDKLVEAANNLSPAIIANYAYDLAKEFNQYYHDTAILKEENKEVLAFRLLLIDNLASVLRKAMGILGIELPERM